MKNAILFRALVTAGALICSSQVMAQSMEASAKKPSLELSFSQLKTWLFSGRSNSASGAKAGLAADSMEGILCYDKRGQPIYFQEVCDELYPPPPPPRPEDCGRECVRPGVGPNKP
jgi:hypothetical protein